MRYRLVATDIDGTLLNEHHQPSPRTRAALAELQARGVIVVLSTGRPPRNIRTLYESLGLSEPVVALNGALTFHPVEDAILLHRPLPSPVASRVLTAIRSVDPEMNVGMEFLDEWYVNHIDDHLKARIAAGLVPVLPVVGNLADIVAADDRGVSKLYFLATPPRRAAIENAFAAAGLSPEITVTSSGKDFVEVLAAGVNKGAALTALADRLGVPLAEIVALGDEENDMQALRLAGLGVAMGNASPRVKSAAQVVTVANTADGWARAIEEYVLAS
ncbi:MAG: Cof-type HAD-IIB family hydrolase [Symbiobacteriia bacterium]